MSSFEQLHPVLTPHFRLDWLTKFPIKEVINELSSDRPVGSTTLEVPEQPLETVHFVNGIMRKVMNQHELTWGISPLNADNFLGLISIQHPHAEVSSLAFWYTGMTTEEFGEILSRVVTFVTDHFDTQKLQIKLRVPHEELALVLAINGFTSDDNMFWTRELS